MQEIIAKGCHNQRKLYLAWILLIIVQTDTFLRSSSKVKMPSKTIRMRRKDQHNGLKSSNGWSKNTWGKNMSSTISVKSIVGVIVVIIVALSLLPIVLDSTAAAAASLTGASATFVNMIPLFYVLAIVLATIYWAIGEVKGRA